LSEDAELSIAQSAREPSDYLPLGEIVSPTHLEELRSMRDILPVLLATLHSDVSECIDAIRTAAGTGDSNALARSAHGIAGAAGSVGGLRLAELCRQLEQRGRIGATEDIGALLALIETEFRFLCDALERISNESANGVLPREANTEPLNIS